MATTIEWTDETWNPVVGCEHISPGCDHCYAAGVASRGMQEAHRGLTIGRQWNGTVRLLPERLAEPLSWRKPRKVFVGSMTDLFHADVPRDFLCQVFATMALARRHTFQVLTKRPQRLSNLLRSTWAVEGTASFESHVEHDVGHFDTEYPVTWPLPNVWLGTSIESDRYTFRADHLRATPAAVRFLSCEPLLGPLPSLDLTGIDWVIVGGESGPGARPMHPDWVRDIRDRCVAAGVPFMFKQWGQWVTEDQSPEDITLPGSALLPWGDRPAVYKVGKHVAGRELDGRTWDEYPKVAQR